MELRGPCRAKKPQGGFFRRHYYTPNPPGKQAEETAEI